MNSDSRATLHALEEALRLAKEATNGWACYAKRKIEHDEIARLHQDIAAVEAALLLREGRQRDTKTDDDSLARIARPE